MPVYQASQENGVLYLAMELLRGETLESRLERHGAFSAGETIRIAREIASGLAVIHRVGTRYEVEDMDSRTGTTVAGRQVRRHRLSSGESIVLGATVLEFEERAKSRTGRAT